MDQLVTTEVEIKNDVTQLDYQKPKTSIFLEKATDIQGGATRILESQGAGSGYLTS